MKFKIDRRDFDNLIDIHKQKLAESKAKNAELEAKIYELEAKIYDLKKRKFLEIDS